MPIYGSSELAFSIKGLSPTQSENDIGSHHADAKPRLSGGMSFSLFLFAILPSGIWKYISYFRKVETHK